MFTQDEADQIRRLIGTAAWRDVVLPRLRQRREAAVNQLILTPSERGPKDEDPNCIRGRILEIDYLLKAFVSDLEIYDHNQRREELARQQFLAANP